MISLNYEPLNAADTQLLQNRQQRVNNQVDFESKVREAKRLWDSKSSSVEGRELFGRIKTKLLASGPGVELCVYCENNEGTDIEHILPKKSCPLHAFVWDNYLLACRTCNTDYKSDKFRVFYPVGSANSVDATSPRGQYIPPVSEEALFLNPYLENPMDYLELDLLGQQFIFIEKHPAGTREYQKAKYTKDLLGLNNRAALVTARKNAAKYYVDRLDRYVHVQESNNFNELHLAIGEDFGQIDQTQSFVSQKDKMALAVKADILTHCQPTVWKELIRQRSHLRKTNELFNQAPEALTW